MNKVSTAVLFEICSFLHFKEMMVLTHLSKHLNFKMKDVLIIFSEREAQRLLFSKCSLLRNPFIEQEETQTTLVNNGWYEFLKNQVETRKWLKVKLWNILPQIFGDFNDDEVNKKLIIKIIQEIKKPSESPPKLLKTTNSVALRTSFQALLYCHVDMKKSMNHESSLVDTQIAEVVTENEPFFAQEIIDNKEEIWLKDFRWYRDKLDVGKAPKSSLLCFLFCLEGFIRCHWEVAYKVIQARRNTENFLDEYGTRWVSYSDLIMTFEEEFYFLENAINATYDSPLIEKEKQLEEEFIPKYSILRMMCRIWGKYVMKRLIPVFTDKIREVLHQYHLSIKNVAQDFKNIIKQKFGLSKLKSRIQLDHVTRELIMQSVQMIVDTSLNEISINYIESTSVQLGIYYPKVESAIINACGSFFDELTEFLEPDELRTIAEIHFSQTRTVFPRTTQRKLHELWLEKWVKFAESKVAKIYKKFWEQYEDPEQSFEDLRKDNTKLKPARRIDSGYLQRIFGLNCQERISTTIKNLVIDQQSGNENFDDVVSDVQSVSDDEESKSPTPSKNVSFLYFPKHEVILLLEYFQSSLWT